MKTKIIKLTENDIVKIVAKIIKEGQSIEEFIASSPDIKPDDSEVDVADDNIDVEPETPGVQVELTLAMNPENNDVYILKDAFSDEPTIVGVVRNAQF